MRKALLFQIVKHLYLVVHLLYDKWFWSMEHCPPPPCDTQLPFDMLFITMFYTCLVTEVVYHRGEQHRIRKSTNTTNDIKISLNNFCYPYTALIPKIWCFFYSINAQFYSNLLLEQMIKILEKDAGFIVICVLRHCTTQCVYNLRLWHNKMSRYVMHLI